MRDWLTALKLYVSPIFLRENPPALLAALYTLACFGIAIHNAATVSPDDGPPVLSGLTGMTWWIAMQNGVMACTTHYWRQIRSPATFLLPRLQKAEHGAIHVASASLILLFSVPLLILHQSFLNILALESIALALWSGADRMGPRSMRRSVRSFHMALSLLGFMVFMIPSMQRAMLTAPWYIVVPVLILCLGLTHHEYRFREYRLDPAPSKPARRRRHAGAPRSTLPRAFQAVLVWRSPFLRRLPLPDLFHTGAPVFCLLEGIVGILLLSAITTIAKILDTGTVPSSAVFMHALPQAAQQLLLLTTMGCTIWMRDRSDWPFLLTLGPYGSKLRFAKAVFLVHMLRALQAATIISGLMILTLALNAPLSLARLPWLFVALLCAVTGASFTPALAFLTKTTNRPSVVLLLICSGSFLLLQCLIDFLLDERTSALQAMLVSVLPLCFVALMIRIAPIRLARQDWPIEPPR